MAKRQTPLEKLAENFNLIFAKAESGDVGILDATIQYNNLKKDVEAVLENAKTKLKENLDEIQKEAAKYKNNYGGFSFSVTSKKDYDYTGVEEIVTMEKELKAVKEKYKLAFEGAQKGTTPIEFDKDEDGNKVSRFVDADGVLRPFPSIKYAAAALTLRKGK